jgi:hypothetical protein
MLNFPWPIVPIALVGGVSALIANLLSHSMIEKLNSALPEREHISYVWWGTEVRCRYKLRYGRDKLIVAQDACVVAMALCFLLSLKYWVFSQL